jgi:4-hydroxy-tetrahydrodipicolinate synthase
MQSNLFYGSGVALVTPFRESRVDYDALENLIDWQIDSDTDALIVLGTTGEPCTLSDAERTSIIECAMARCARRVPMIVGAGSNDTRTAIRHAEEAQMLKQQTHLSF